MIQSTNLIINHILKFNNYRSEEILRKHFRELLTTFSELKKKNIVLIPSFIKLAKRTESKLKPKVVLADGFYSADKIVKRLTDYGWAFVFRWRCNRKLSETSIKKLIPRGYGEKTGYLKNNSKVKIFRRKNRFFETNRMLMSVQNMVSLYKQRWTIEEVFRVLKVCIGINRCQQHSVLMQEVLFYCCLVVFYCLERIKTTTLYKLKQAVNSQSVCFDNSIFMDVFKPC